jgi:hypothetical protein
MRLAATTLAFLALAAPAAAKPGDLDRTFGHGGRIAFAGGEGYSDASDVALDERGRPLVVGGSLGRRIAGRWVVGPTLARLTRSGRVDFRAPLPAPRNDGSLSNSKVIALPDGGALAGALLETPPGLARSAIWRVRPDGTLDPAFGQGGAVELSLPDAHLGLVGLGVDAAGRIAVLAQRGPYTAPDTVLARLRPDGTLESLVTVATGMVPDALLLERTGRALIAGHREGDRGRKTRALVYAAGTRGQVRRIASLAMRSERRQVADVAGLIRGPRGTFLLAGSDGRKPRSAWSERPWFARLTRTGRVTRTSLPPTKKKIEILAMARDHRGRIVLAGDDYTVDGIAVVLRLTPYGRLDRRFGRGGLVRKQLGARPRTILCCSQARAVAIDARNRILVAGVTFDADAPREDLGRSYFAVARLKG